MGINWVLYTENVVGRNHPSLADVANRPLQDVVEQSGYARDGSNFAGFAHATHTHDTSAIVSGVLGVARGGLGVATIAAGALLLGAGASPVAALAAGSAGHYVRDTGTAWASSALLWSDVSGAPTTLAGYGIADAYTKTASDARYAAIAGPFPWADISGVPTTLAGHGITDAYTKTASDARYAAIAGPFPWADVSGAPTTLAGYGISDAYTKTAADARYAAIAGPFPWADVTGAPTTLAGYGIADAYTKTASDARFAPIAGPFAWINLSGQPTTLAGYGITDAYTKTASDGRYLPISGAAISAGVLVTARTIGITGDLTYTSPAFDGSGNVTASGVLATVNGNPGNWGSSTAIPVFTVNGKGLITAVSTAAIIAPAGTLTGTTLSNSVVTSSLTSVGVLSSPHMTAAVVDSGGFTVTAGTTAVQALTATSGTFAQGIIATTLDLNPGGNTHVKVGTWSGSSAYNYLSLNNDTTAGTGVGMFGGASGDSALYLAAANGFLFKNANVNVFTISAGGAGVLAGGLTIAAGGLSVAAGGASVNGASSFSSTVSVANSLSVGGGQTFRGNATYPGGADDMQPINLANNANIAIGDTNTIATVQIADNAVPNAAIVFLRGGLHAVTIGLAIAGTWGTTQGAANNYNVYWDSGTATYRLENRSGGLSGFFIKRTGQVPS